MPFIPHTEQEVAAMLATIGVATLDELFDEIPAALRGAALPELPPALSESELTRLMRARAHADGEPLCFVGAGAYPHHIPAAVWQLVGRGEFYSAYTPYQAEASQGTLQVLYEFQSMMTALTALDASNASLYDGASALAEAVAMAVRAQRGPGARRVLLPRAVHPRYRQVTRTLVRQQGIELVEIDYAPRTGQTAWDALEAQAGTPCAALVVPQPNFFGVLEDTAALTDWAHRQGALVIGLVNPLALALLTPPGEWGARGADIACGEAQPFGIPLAGGGPYLGLLCCRQELVRQLPGRVVGRTRDRAGQVGYTLTLQAREQHIRRAKATSNICTNQGLLATAATLYLALLGPAGLERVARRCHAQQNRLTELLRAVPGVAPRFDGPVFHERVWRVPRPPADFLPRLAAAGLLAGFDPSDDYPELGPALLVCTTEIHAETDLLLLRDRLAQVLSEHDPNADMAPPG